MMPHIYEHVFEQFRIVGSDDSSIADNFADYASEANTVINNYNLLSRDDKQSLLNYLRSL